MKNTLVTLAILSLFTSAHGASFDCKKAAKAVERLICGDTDVSGLDDALAEVFTLALETADKTAVAALQKAQKAWLATRDACSDVACITQKYEERLMAMTCDPNARMAGSAIGTNQCSYYSLRLLDRELTATQARYSASIGSADNSNNPEYTKRVASEEQVLWRKYRVAQCALYGATEGGSDGWKNAFAGMCEVDETKKRIARLTADTPK